MAGAAALVTFFVTSSALTRFKGELKARRGVLAQAKGGERDAWQVLANGGVAALCLGVAGGRGSGGFLGALATAGADTWGTELGLLARRGPRLLTTLRPVPPGTSGGVTPEGTLASVAGALTVGAAWGTVRRLQTRRPARGAVLLAGVAGTLGALGDSLIGATVQAGYWCPRCHQPTEAPVHGRCGYPAEHVRGWRWITNDVVNALATGGGAVAGAALGGALLREGRAPISGPIRRSPPTVQRRRAPAWGQERHPGPGRDQ